MPHGPSIAFLPHRRLHYPLNNREYHVSRELVARGWRVRWLLQASGTNEGVEFPWPLTRFPDLDVRGRTYLLPVYLATALRRVRVDAVWLSGWALRSLPELMWMVRILKLSGLRVIYDPIDPICEYESAIGHMQDECYATCIRTLTRVFRLVDLTFCVTPEMRDLLASHGAPMATMRVARWGTDSRFFDPANVTPDLKERLGLAPDTFLVGWLGSLDPSRGLEEIILPLTQQLPAKLPGIHFVLAGRALEEQAGALGQRVRAWVARHSALPISILPSIPYAYAPSFTSSLDAYLMPTEPGTAFARAICPVKCFDALLMGTHTVITKTSATAFLDAFPDLVSLCAFDRGSFDQALTRLYHSPRRRRARQIDSRFIEFTHQSVARSMADALHQLLQLPPHQSDRELHGTPTPSPVAR